MCHSIVDVSSSTLRGSNIEVSLSKSDDLPQVHIDPDQITQVLTNLIVNAEHALRDVTGDRLLRISSRHDAVRQQVVIKVRDNGPGIASDIRRRIFEPMFTTKEVGQGTGLGLSVSYFIITEHHDGTIEVDSTPGKGTLFSIRLPLSHAVAEFGARN